MVNQKLRRDREVASLNDRVEEERAEADDGREFEEKKKRARVEIGKEEVSAPHGRHRVTSKELALARNDEVVTDAPHARAHEV